MTITDLWDMDLNADIAAMRTILWMKDILNMNVSTAKKPTNWSLYQDNRGLFFEHIKNSFTKKRAYKRNCQLARHVGMIKYRIEFYKFN